MAKQERKGRNGARHGRGRWTFGAGVAAAVVVALIVGWFAYRAQANLPGQKFADLGNLHVQTVGDPHEPYNSTPPTSGPHLPYIAPWGIHTRPIPNELQVHNLEDGGVVVQEMPVLPSACTASRRMRARRLRRVSRCLR